MLGAECWSPKRNKVIYSELLHLYDLSSDHSNAPMRRAGSNVLKAKSGSSRVGRRGTRLITRSNRLGEEAMKSTSARTTGNAITRLGVSLTPVWQHPQLS